MNRSKGFTKIGILSLIISTVFTSLLLNVKIDGKITIADSAQAADEPVYLMAAARASLNGWDSGGPYTEETNGKYGIYFLSSSDGTNFDYASPNRMISESGLGDAQTRDAAILWKNNKFWIMWPHSPTDGVHFDFASSTDLENWTYHTPFTHTGAQSTAGGSWFVDETGLVHALLPFSSAPNIASTVTYESHPEDANNLEGSWTDPEVITYTSTDPETEEEVTTNMSSYDPTIFYCGSTRYFLIAPYNRWYKNDTGNIRTGWTPYVAEGGNTTSVNSMAEGFSAIPTTFDSENNPTVWRVYADDKAGGAYAKTAYVDLTVNGTSFTTGPKVQTEIGVNPFGPNVIKLTDQAAITAVRNLQAKWGANPELDLSYSATSVEGRNSPLNSDYNYPNRTYTLANPGESIDWELDFQLPSTVYDDAYSGVPTNPTAAEDVELPGQTEPRSDYQNEGLHQYRIYPYKKAGSLVVPSSGYAAISTTVHPSDLGRPVNISWTAAPDADGYFVTTDSPYHVDPDNPESTFVYYRDISSGTSFIDKWRSEWTLGASSVLNTFPDIIPEIPTGWKWNITVNLRATSNTVHLAINTVDKYLNYENIHTFIADSQDDTIVYFELTWNGTAYEYAEDTAPPVTSLTRNGSTITLSATDTMAGLDTIYYKWDSDSYRPYSVPLTVPSEARMLYYYSVDKAGNAETVKTLEVGNGSDASEDTVVSGTSTPIVNPVASLATTLGSVASSESASSEVITSDSPSISPEGITNSINSNPAVEDDDTSDTDTDTNWPMIGGIALVVIVGLGVAIVVRRRRL